MSKRDKIILLVDDEPDHLELMHQFLKKEFDTKTASSGEEALRLLEVESFDLVITNLMMPNISGFGLVTILKDRYPKLPVILVSASFGAESVYKVYQKYVEACLAKPIDPNMLITKIKNVLGASSDENY